MSSYKVAYNCLIMYLCICKELKIDVYVSGVCSVEIEYICLTCVHVRSLLCQKSKIIICETWVMSGVSFMEI